MKIIILKMLSVLLVYSTIPAVNANEIPTDIIEANIEKVLAVPSTELEYKTAVELKAALAAPAASQETINAARSICYSSLPGYTNLSIIMVPLSSNLADLNAICRVATNNNNWHAGGVAKSNYYSQDCRPLDNHYYGGGYTSYITKASFDEYRARLSSCGPTNAMVCCSDQFPK